MISFGIPIPRLTLNPTTTVKQNKHYDIGRETDTIISGQIQDLNINPHT